MNKLVRNPFLNLLTPFKPTSMSKPTTISELTTLFRSSIQPLPTISSPSFAPNFDTFASNRLILLGDGSHGTSEFYAARAEITKRLISQHGFTIVALEADWPDAEALDRYVRQRPGRKAKIGGEVEGDADASGKKRGRGSGSGRGSEEVFEAFKRFPTWMWRNTEMHDLIEWMREHNASLPPEKRVGIYGMDLYSLGTSIKAVIEYLDHIDPVMATAARKRYGCLEPWVEEPQEYGLATVQGMASCEGEIVAMLKDLLEKRLEYAAHPGNGEEFHSSEQNAYVVRDAERYYRAMYYSSAGSWTLRDSHMVDTLKRLMRYKTERSKAVVWAHNSHCGDARHTAMGVRRREVNIGQLCRESFGAENVALIGCGTHTGTVAAASSWGDDMRVMRVKPSMRESWERVAHETGVESFLLDLREGKMVREVREALGKEKQRLQRFIGVIYRPDTERVSHYSAADLVNQFDGYVWFDTTQAVKPLEVHQPKTALGDDETYPFGL
ncbi:erythromycin esterase-domain-containing protein [Aspergillus granulosus]|uniref:Erythromycin esterase-domain-containing protein n=1 Tax=Aspergillus granulosus TaxID=176169 RepID=A0ABR4I416_9EURO